MAGHPGELGEREKGGDEVTEFEEFGKIARLSRACIITEKIDGTNAQVWIERDPHSDGDMERSTYGGLCVFHEKTGEFYRIQAGSRNRWITPEDDNFGFAKWAYDHARELVDGLGEGRHFGEWWGSGIQRGYGLKGGEKRFSLFNTSRWVERSHFEPLDGQQLAPECCYVVPVLYRGLFTTTAVEQALEVLRGGSVASPGFARPEGVIVYHEAARAFFKKTLEKDAEPKGKVA